MLVMSDEAETDRKLQHSQRMLNTSLIKVDYHGKPTVAGIERRSQVRDELVTYIGIHTGMSKEGISSLIPPVHRGTTDDPLHSRKRKARRRSLETYGSDESDA